jgi:diguanylate cyclase (GGDEF)-like protein/PAS domain S-box-containing protein
VTAPKHPGNTATPSDPAFFKGLLDHMSDGVYFVDRDRRILYWNDGAARLTGYTSEELVGRSCQDDTLCHVDGSGTHLCQNGCPLTASITDGGLHEAQVFLRHKQGWRVPVLVRVQPIRDTNGEITGAVEIFSDDSAQHAARRKNEELERLAFLDQVTKLPNRRYVEMSLQTVLSEYRVHNDAFGVLLIDLDRFKNINDRFGHANGDRALQEVAKTLVGTLRTTDIVGRWGGDEFLAVVRHVNHDNLTMLAERCCTLVAETSLPVGEGEVVSLSVSIGGALVTPEDGPESIVHQADDAMYRGKVSGRGRAVVV